LCGRSSKVVRLRNIQGVKPDRGPSLESKTEDTRDRARRFKIGFGGCGLAMRFARAPWEELERPCAKDGICNAMYTTRQMIKKGPAVLF
jgi:hypothetical protein